MESVQSQRIVSEVADGFKRKHEKEMRKAAEEDAVEGEESLVKSADLNTDQTPQG